MAKTKTEVKKVSTASIDSALKAIENASLTAEKALANGYKDDVRELIETLKTAESDFKKVKYDVPNYAEKYPTSLGEVKLDATKATQDEITAQAESGLLSEKNEKTTTLNENALKKLNKLDEKAASAVESSVAEKQSNLENLQATLQKQQNAMIKQGLAHSSIAENAASEAKARTTEILQKIDADLDAELSGIRADKAAVNEQYNSALRGYEIKYAVNLEKKIASLSAAEEKRISAINKYNSAVDKREAAYQSAVSKTVADKEASYIASKDAVSNVNDADTVAQTEKYYSQIKSFYDSLEPLTAITLIDEFSDELAEYIGRKRLNNLRSGYQNIK